MVRCVALLSACAAFVGVGATVATARPTILSATTPTTPPLRTAIFDDQVFQGPGQSAAFATASHVGATYVRLDTGWGSVAPPVLPHAWTLSGQSDPASPYYGWDALDATVAAAQANGIQPILDIVGTPSWAYHVAPGVRAGGRPTGGQPDINELGAFATALARRYPTVHAFSVYNEPNLSKNFYPQDPTYYRSMVNAVAEAVHGVNPANLVLAGELAPFKHPNTKAGPNNVIAPIAWMQQMLCISNTVPAHRTCNTQAKFDIWTHHPYSDTGPFGHAVTNGGVELGDLPKMTALLKTAWQLGAIATESGTPPKFWVTEIGWSSNPPNKHGVPIWLETRWVGESFYQLWRSGATLGTWLLLRDRPRTTTFQSGLYFSSAQPKPLLAPFRFPFVAYLKTGGNVFLWGRDATSNTQTVTIQMKISSTWKTVATITSNSYGIFQATLPLKAKAAYMMRASAGGFNSAPFSLTVPANENMHVVPFPLN